MKKVLVGIAALLGIGSAVVVGTKEKQEKAKKEKRHVPYGPYEALFKRPLDIVLSSVALIVLSPVLLITSILVRIKLGSPVVFTQLRPGLVDPKTGQERIFKLYKFRTMTDERDENGELLSDEQRLTNFGKKLRATSIDELPELINIIKGDMSLIGPRPQLVRDAKDAALNNGDWTIFKDLIKREINFKEIDYNGLSVVDYIEKENSFDRIPKEIKDIICI